MIARVTHMCRYTGAYPVIRGTQPTVPRHLPDHCETALGGGWRAQRSGNDSHAESRWQRQGDGC
jgi:hypothetical protein